MLRKYRKCIKKKIEKMLDFIRGCICENNIFIKRDIYKKNFWGDRGIILNIVMGKIVNICIIE